MPDITNMNLLYAESYLEKLLQTDLHENADLKQRLNAAGISGGMSLSFRRNPSGEYSFTGTPRHVKSFTEVTKVYSITMSNSEILRLAERQQSLNKIAQEENQRKAKIQAQQAAMQRAREAEVAKWAEAERIKLISKGILPMDILAKAARAIQNSSKDQIKTGFDMHDYQQRYSSGSVHITKSNTSDDYVVHVSGFNARTSFSLTKQEVENLANPELASQAKNKNSKIESFIDLNNVTYFLDRPDRPYVMFNSEADAAKVIQEMNKTTAFRNAGRLSAYRDITMPNARWIELTGEAKAAVENALAAIKEPVVDMEPVSDAKLEFDELDDILETLPHPEYFGQGWLMKAMPKFGYKADEGGICFGITRMANHAMLLGEMDKFNHRLDLIDKLMKKYFKEDVGMMDRLIDFIKNKDKHPELSAEEYNALLEIRPLFDGIEMYHNAIHHKEGFFSNDQTVIGQHTETISKLMLPDTLSDKGFSQAASITGHYSGKELSEMLMSLRDASKGLNAKDPVTLMIGSHNHAIAVGYDPEKKAFTFLDPNSIPAQVIMSDTNKICELVSNYILGAFPNSDGTIPKSLSLATEVYGINDKNGFEPSELARVWQADKRMVAMHKVTDQKASNLNDDNSNWLLMALRAKNLKAVYALLENNSVNLFQAAKRGGSPDFDVFLSGDQNLKERFLTRAVEIKALNKQSVKMSYEELFKKAIAYKCSSDLLALIASKPEFNPDSQEHNILGVAQNNSTILSELILSEKYPELTISLINKSSNVNWYSKLDSEFDSGDSLLGLAVKGGNVDFVKALLAKGADPNFENKQGQSLVMLAVDEKSMEIIELLDSYGANIDYDKLIEHIDDSIESITDELSADNEDNEEMTDDEIAEVKQLIDEFEVFKLKIAAAAVEIKARVRDEEIGAQKSPAPESLSKPLPSKPLVSSLSQASIAKPLPPTPSERPFTQGAPRKPLPPTPSANPFRQSAPSKPLTQAQPISPTRTTPLQEPMLKSFQEKPVSVMGTSKPNMVVNALNKFVDNIKDINKLVSGKYDEFKRKDYHQYKGVKRVLLKVFNSNVLEKRVSKMVKYVEAKIKSIVSKASERGSEFSRAERGVLPHQASNPSGLVRAAKNELDAVEKSKSIEMTDTPKPKQ